MSAATLPRNAERSAVARWRVPLPGELGRGLRRTAPLVLLLLIVIEAPQLLFGNHGHIDLEVYRAGGSAALHGTALYGPAFAAGTPLHLAFTYPPPAAVFLVPLALLPDGVVAALWLLGELIAIVAMTTVAFGPLVARVYAAKGLRAALLTRAALCVAMLRICPVNDHLGFGQIDLFLLLLVSADLLIESPRWPRGVLIGLAAATKLVPGVFIVYLLVTGRRREAAVAAATLAAAVGIGFVILPGASETYWRHGVFDTSTIVVGAGARFSNQSLRGILLRTFPHEAVSVLWVVLGLIVAVVGYSRARRAHLAGDELLAVVLVALIGTALSPVSWIHHLVWLGPALGLLVADGRDRRRLVTGAVLLVLLWARLPYLGDDLGQAGGPVVLAEPLRSAYGLMGLALLGWLPVRTPVWRATRAAKTPAP